MSSTGNIVSPHTRTCPKCNRDLELVVEMRVNGKTQVMLRCPKHGSLPKGWQRQLLQGGLFPTVNMRGKQ